MKKTLLALSLALAATVGFAASHTGAPMKPASGAAPAGKSASAPMATPATPATPSPMAAASGTMTKADAKAADKKSDADYKAAKAACKPMKGDEQKKCTKEAKAKHDQEQKDIKAATKK